jgi:hypothetical protein
MAWLVTFSARNLITTLYMIYILLKNQSRKIAVDYILAGESWLNDSKRLENHQRYGILSKSDGRRLVLEWKIQQVESLPADLENISKLTTLTGREWFIGKGWAK